MIGAQIEHHKIKKMKMTKNKPYFIWTYKHKYLWDNNENITHKIQIYIVSFRIYIGKNTEIQSKIYKFIKLEKYSNWYSYPDR